MKSLILLPITMLMGVSLVAQWLPYWPVQTIKDNGSSGQRVNISITGDGYVDSTIAEFHVHAQAIMNDLFNTTPFKEYEPFFNVYTIEVLSDENGVDHPGTAPEDSPAPVFPVETVDTYFETTFDFNNIHRLVVPKNKLTLLQVLVLNTPFYDQALLIANSPHYGGSGGATAATSTVHGAASEISIHEIGHSFADLADEYWSGATGEKANRTAESDPASVKWSAWVGQQGIGVYKYGPNPPQSNWHRPHQSCKMRLLNHPFCAVCVQTFIDNIYSKVDPLDSHSPANDMITYSGSSINASINVVYPNPNTIEIVWKLNGATIATNVTNVEVTGDNLQDGENNLKVYVIDKTPMSKSNLPRAGYQFSLRWRIQKTPPEVGEREVSEDAQPIEMERFFYKVYPNPTYDEAFIETYIEGGERKIWVEVMNADGRTLKQQVYQAFPGKQIFSVNLSDLSSGIYFIRLFDGDEVNETVRVIKE